MAAYLEPLWDCLLIRFWSERLDFKKQLACVLRDDSRRIPGSGCGASSRSPHRNLRVLSCARLGQSQTCSAIGTLTLAEREDTSRGIASGRPSRKEGPRQTGWGS